MNRSLDTFAALAAKQPVVATQRDTAWSILQKLWENNITSVVVVSEGSIKREVLGVVDCLDLLAMSVTKLGNVKLEDMTPEEVRQRFQEFKDTPVSHLMDLSRRDKLMKLPLDATMGGALQKFVSEPFSVHRISLVDQGIVVHILTQFEFLQFFFNRLQEMKQEIPNLDSICSKRIWEISEKTTQPSIVTVVMETPTIQAFRLMHETGLSSVGVINDRNQLVSVLSATDIKGLYHFSLWDLFKPLADFIPLLRQHQSKPSRYLVCCQQNTPFQDCVITMLREHVHRLFIVDDNNFPVGLVSLTDVLNELSHAIHTGASGKTTEQATTGQTAQATVTANQ